MDTQPPSSNPLDHFLVLGLGSLGQHCIVALKEFGVPVIAIEQTLPQEWEIPNCHKLLKQLIIGDCCQDTILEQAQIERCRAALIVTSNERVNAETAIAIRQLNPHTRLVIRSGKHNLNQLLSQQLGNFTAFEPTQLPAAAFAIAALGTDTLGFFNLDGQWLRVVKQTLPSHHPWVNTRQLGDLNHRHRRLLLYFPAYQPTYPSFYNWHPDTYLHSADTLVYVETADQFLIHQQEKEVLASQAKKRQRWQHLWQQFTWRNVQQQLSQFWQLSFQQQLRRVSLFSGFIILCLLGLGTILFHLYTPETSLVTAFYYTAILLLGGYGDLFSNFAQPDIPWQLQLFALSLTIAGTAFVGVLYALLTEALLSSQFQFTKKRPPIPSQDHVVIIGLGRVGQRVARLLQTFKQPLVGITLNTHFDLNLLPHIPLIKGNLQHALPQSNIATAKSVVVATDDEIVNLEVALMAYEVNPNTRLAIRTYGQRLSRHLSTILPQAQVLCTYAVMAEAFAGAAFGEKILSLFRFDQQTILVTEYQIEAIDTLHGLLLGDIAYGYGVVPLLHQKPPASPRFMPWDDVRVEIGDRLVVLATIEGLRRVEIGSMFLKRWHVQIKKVNSTTAAFEGANILARVSGCPLGEARNFMTQLPATWPSPFYEHQGQRLVRELTKARIQAVLI
ncbi:NAD-binding protein [Spirulina sp. CS-785/01]|uniref:potassium channel family protein n=1 Tax=Spirulina sp. CS-785/01 TaxID=3021716 RepID=UPI00233133CC|nr:NAD-binding protein [Spirulina sp. CS-785/01]MDB9312010.1 NAD-binding protein [Spirulina sp. CS-785/01]